MLKNNNMTGLLKGFSGILDSDWSIQWSKISKKRKKAFSNLNRYFIVTKPCIKIGTVQPPFKTHFLNRSINNFSFTLFATWFAQFF